MVVVGIDWFEDICDMIYGAVLLVLGTPMMARSGSPALEQISPVACYVIMCNVNPGLINHGLLIRGVLLQ